MDTSYWYITPYPLIMLSPNLEFTGYWFLDDADDSTKKKWTPPEDLLSFIDGAHANGKKVVYIGFGSIVVSDPEAMTRCVIDAIVQSGIWAILSKGWSDRLSTKKGPQPEGDNAELPTPSLPPQIYSLTSVPHDWLFPRIDAACKCLESNPPSRGLHGR